jgi:hypothetical protein
LAIAKLNSKKPAEVKKAIAHNPSCDNKRNQNTCKYPTSSNQRISATSCEAKSNNSHKPSSSTNTPKVRFMLLILD